MLQVSHWDFELKRLNGDRRQIKYTSEIKSFSSREPSDTPRVNSKSRL